MKRAGALLLLALAAVGPARAGHDLQRTADVGWPINGGVDNIRYSPLTEINSGNVSQLTVAWT